MTDQKRLFTPAEVAAELHPAIAESDIRRRARRGDIEYTQGGKRRILFTRAQIEALLDSMAKTPKPQPAPALELTIIAEQPNVFGTTNRSHRRSQHSQAVSV